MEKKVEYYTIRPSLKQYFGRKVNKSLKFEANTTPEKPHKKVYRKMEKYIRF